MNKENNLKNKLFDQVTSLLDNNFIKLLEKNSFKVKPSFNLPKNANVEMVKLKKVNKNTLDILSMTKDLRYCDSKVITKILNDILQDSDIVEVNEFNSWNKDYLTQLLYYRASHLATLLEDKNSFISKNEKLKNIFQQGSYLVTSLNYYKNTYLIRLNNSENSTTPYPINKEGVSAIKELDKLESKIEKYLTAYNNFLSLNKK